MRLISALASAFVLGSVVQSAPSSSSSSSSALLLLSSSLRSDDAASVSQLVADSQQEDGTWGSLEASASAIRALKSLSSKPVAHSSKACKSISSLVSASLGDASSDDQDRLSDLHYGIYSLLQLECTQSLPDIKPLLQRGLSSSNLYDIYHSTETVFLLADSKIVSVHDFDFSKCVPTIIECMEDDGTYRSQCNNNDSDNNDSSAYTAGLGLEILGDIFKYLPEHEDAHRDAMRKASTKIKSLMDKGMMEDSTASSTGSTSIASQLVDFTENAPEGVSSTQILAALLRGIDSLSSSLSEQLEISPTNVYRIANTLLTMKSPTNILDASALIDSLSRLSSNSFSIPLVLSISSFTNNKIQVKLTNVLDKHATNAKVTIESIVSSSSGKSILRDVSLASGSDLITYSASLSPPLEPGIYTLFFSVQPVSESGFGGNEKFLSAQGVERRSKISRSSSSLGGIQLSAYISDSAKTSESESAHTVTYPATLSSKLAGDSSKYLHVRVQFAGKFSPQQVFVELVFKSSSKSASFVAKQSGDSSYLAKLSLGSSEVVDSIYGAGEYSLNIIIGDPLLDSAIIWKAGSVSLQVPSPAGKGAGAGPSGVSDVSELFAMKPEIKHAFRQPDARPNKLFALIFTLAAGAPLAGVVMALLAKRVSLSLPNSASEYLSAIMFQGSLLAILLLYLLYWLMLNIFQALTLLAILGVIATFSGNQALRLLHLRSTAASGTGKPHVE